MNYKMEMHHEVFVSYVCLVECVQHIVLYITVKA